jgi:nucleoside-diphosphate-sugar epimerase
VPVHHEEEVIAAGIERKEALVVGASGLLGSTLLEHLRQQDDWNVTAMSRRRPEAPDGIRHVSLDLLDRSRCLEELRQLSHASHVFFCPRAVESGYVIRTEPNVDMLRNLLDGLEPFATALCHVQLVHGLKWYGSHVGPFRNPADERDPRLPGNPTFYYEQHDLVEQRQAGRPWSWSSVRPHFICGVATRSPSNLIGAIGAYAAILHELGRPLSFPGSAAAWNARLTYTDAKLLVRAMVRVATEPRCANQAFNIVNGDAFRWRDVWPRIAAHHAMDAGTVEPISLVTFMEDKAPIWDTLVQKHGLVQRSLEDVADWAFADAVFRLGWDQTASVARVREHGLSEDIDTAEMFLRILHDYRTLRLLP